MPQFQKALSNIELTVKNPKKTMFENLKGIDIIRIATVLDVTAAAGAAAYISFDVIPAIKLASPPVASQQWKHVYLTGKKVIPSSVAVACAGFVYLAQHSSMSNLYYLAAGVGLSIVPFTLAVMQSSTLVPLVDMADSLQVQCTAEDSKRFDQLVDKWTVQHSVRAALLFVSASIGAYTIFME